MIAGDDLTDAARAQATIDVPVDTLFDRLHTAIKEEEIDDPRVLAAETETGEPILTASQADEVRVRLSAGGLACDLPVDRDRGAADGAIAVDPGEPIVRLVQRLTHGHRVARSVGD